MVVVMAMVRKHREDLAGRTREVSCPELIYDRVGGGAVMKPQSSPDIIPQAIPMLLSKRETTTNHPTSDPGFLSENYEIPSFSIGTPCVFTSWWKTGLSLLGALGSS